MRVVTLNTWKNEGDYPRRLRLMAEGVAALNPDIVCLQECFVGAGRDTAATLAAALGLRLHAAPARAKLRAHEGRLVRSTSGLAVLGPQQARSGVLPLPDDPADGERIAQRLDLTVCGRPLRLLNLHLTHLRGEAAASLRGVQLRTALDWARGDLAGALVVAGDLNAAAGSPELAPLPARPAPSTLQAPRGDGQAHEGQAIDHCCLVQAGAWRAVARRVALDEVDPDGYRPSDHKAVVLDLEPA